MSLLKNIRRSDHEDDIESFLNELDNILRSIFSVIGSPLNERELLNGLEVIFIARKMNYSRETERIRSGSRVYVPDFIINDWDCALEAKYCDSSYDVKAISKQINDDIRAYEKHLFNVFIIYDLGYIAKPDQFQKEYEKRGIYCRVIKR